MKRRSKGDAGADGGFDGSGIAFRGDPHSYERRRTYGPVPRRRVGMHGAALVRIPNPFAKSEATPPRPFRDCASDSASQSRPEALAFAAAGGRSRLRIYKLAPTSSSAERGEPRRRPGIQRKTRQRRKIFRAYGSLILDSRTARFLAIRGCSANLKQQRRDHRA